VPPVEAASALCPDCDELERDDGINPVPQYVTDDASGCAFAIRTRSAVPRERSKLARLEQTELGVDAQADGERFTVSTRRTVEAAPARWRKLEHRPTTAAVRAPKPRQSVALLEEIAAAAELRKNETDVARRARRDRLGRIGAHCVHAARSSVGVSRIFPTRFLKPLDALFQVDQSALRSKN
jgi:hypothetical protein